MNKEIIAKRLTTAREALGISKAEAARRLNLTYLGYSRYEYGDRTPSPQMLELIAQCYGTSVDYLTGKADDSSADYIIISKREAPVLFELIGRCRNSERETQKRLVSYYEKISRKEDPSGGSL